MTRRFAPVLAASLAVVAAAACAAAPSVPSASPASPAQTPTGVPLVSPPVEPTPVPVPIVTPDVTPEATTPPDAGNVDTGYPELTVEPKGPDTILATLEDPGAKAWRLVVTGTGSQAADRLEIVVETSDVEPEITAREVRDGALVRETDLFGLVFGSGTGTDCHGTLPVCIDASGFRLPEGGDGLLSVRLTITADTTPLTVTGATATWPGEPFILGPWTNTEPFAWPGR
jgi:hypothetical protein